MGLTISNVTESILATFLGILSVYVWSLLSGVIFGFEWHNTMLKVGLQIGSLIFCVTVLFVIPYRKLTEYKDERGDD